MLRKMTEKLTLKSTAKLLSGHEIPRLGFGVYRMPKEDAAELCNEALKTGYRHIDSASSYRNQGQSADGIHLSKLPRESIFFTTKIPMSGKPLNYENAHYLVDKALEDTKLGYLDLVLLHSPYGGPENRKAAWKALVESVEAGKIRSIGVSNFGVHHLDELKAYIKELEQERGGPGKGGVISVGQYELHPWLTRPDIVKWCQDNGVVIEAYAPIVRATRFGDPKIVAIAKKHGKSEAQILLRWSLQKGFVPLVKTATKSRLAENADLYDFELTEEEMKEITTEEYSPCCWDPNVEPLDK